MAFQLTKGALKRILDEGEIVDPILHILQMKNIQNNMDGMTRYKVTLFDGESQHTFGILATQKNHLVDSGEFKIGSVIKLQEFASNVLSKDPPKVVVILLNFEILGEMDIKPQAASLNEPVTKKETPLTEKVLNEIVEPKKEVAPSNAKTFFNNKEAAPVAQKTVKQTPAATPASANNNNNNNNNTQSGMFNGCKVVGIKSLNPYQNKWAIKARLYNKSAIRTYKNAKGEGKLFNVEFMDSTGEIRATGFNDQLDKFYETLNVDSVYHISRAQLKTANRQYSKIDNDYEITFNNDTVIELCTETDNMPRIQVSLVQLSDLPNIQPNEYVDIIAVVKSTGDVSTITAKATGKELVKRELYLVDSSNAQVACTLWATQAEEFDGSEHPVIMFKGAKVSDFGGRSLSVTSQTIVQINPDIPEAHAIRGWYDQGGSDAETKNLSDARSGSGSAASINTPWKTLDVMKENTFGQSEKGDYFQVNAVILYAKKDNSMYMACPGENCNKKVIDQNDGNYRCEKCNRVFQEFRWRMILNVNMCDFTDSNWVTLFQETAECVLETTSEDLGVMKQSAAANYDDVFGNAVFKEYTFKLRAKMETYNDENKLKVTALSAEPINYVLSSRRLLDSIKKYADNPY
jgi:replication factor A1